MTDIKLFENPEFGQVRVIVQENGEPLFVGIDVASILGYKEPHKAIVRHVEDVDRMKHPVSDNQGFTRDTWLINESGLYSLIFSSELLTAKSFKRWVTSEVLPSIRKTGSYSVQQMLPQTFAQALRAYADEVEKNEQLRLEVGQQKQVISELQPKATYYDLILSSIDCLTVTQIAKDYGMTAQALNQFLFEKKVQFKQSGTWLLYQNHADRGYTKSETVPITYKNGEKGSKLNTKWTQKGRLFLYQLLKNNNILPLMEREL